MPQALLPVERSPTGKACRHLNRAADIDPAALREVISRSYRRPAPSGR
ncbi:MAG TPA: hypothetical protein VFC16_20555 [Nakamurella sp.]|nr:hypothetical protein [Nakamurella sp.]